MLTTRFGRASFVAANRCIRLNHTAAKPTIGFIGLGNMVREYFSTFSKLSPATHCIESD
jgi:hypothetical protein